MNRKARRRKSIIIWSIVAAVIIVAFVLSFLLRPSDGSRKGTADTGISGRTVTVGVIASDATNERIWKTVAADAKRRYGLNVRITTFSDYNQPNSALESGDLDLNAFQHHAFLKQWNEANKGDLVSIGETYISPIRLYSDRYGSVSRIPDGSTIAVPNDPTNQGRALLVLKNAGLIGLKKGTTASSATLASISSNPKKLTVKALDAAQTARVLPDVAGSVINNDFANAARIPASKTIYVEPSNADSHQWNNVIAAKRSKGSDPAYRAVVRCYQTDKIRKLIDDAYHGMTRAAWTTK